MTLIWHTGYPADFDPDAVEYGSKWFVDRQGAIDWAHRHDLDHEGKVYVEELFNDGIPDDWREVEAIYCFEDGTTETECRRYYHHRNREKQLSSRGEIVVAIQELLPRRKFLRMTDVDLACETPKGFYVIVGYPNSPEYNRINIAESLCFS